MSESDVNTITEKNPEKSFRIKSDNSKILKSIVETLGNIIDESKIEVSPDALVIKAMDPSRICLLKLSLGKECFEEYQCSQKTSIGINLDSFDKVLKRSTSQDQITLSYNNSEAKIKISMKQEEKTRAKNFTLRLISLDVEEVPVENLESIEYDSFWTMDPEFLVEAIRGDTSETHR
ncbi:MAG: hypothetical protein ACFFAS_20385 [Promethearchaeota archaeon]